MQHKQKVLFLWLVLECRVIAILRNPLNIVDILVVFIMALYHLIKRTYTTTCVHRFHWKTGRKPMHKARNTLSLFLLALNHESCVNFIDQEFLLIRFNVWHKDSNLLLHYHQKCCISLLIVLGYLRKVGEKYIKKFFFDEAEPPGWFFFVGSYDRF